MREKPEANKHRKTVAIVSLVGILLTFSSLAWVWHSSLEEYRQHFNYDAYDRSDMLVEYLDEQLLELDGLKRFIEGKTNRIVT
jgi:hypothetical protein